MTNTVDPATISLGEIMLINSGIRAEIDKMESIMWQRQREHRAELIKLREERDALKAGALALLRVQPLKCLVCGAGESQHFAGCAVLLMLDIGREEKGGERWRRRDT